MIMSTISFEKRLIVDNQKRRVCESEIKDKQEEGKNGTYAGQSLPGGSCVKAGN